MKKLYFILIVLTVLVCGSVGVWWYAARAVPELVWKDVRTAIEQHNVKIVESYIDATLSASVRADMRDVVIDWTGADTTIVTDEYMSTTLRQNSVSPLWAHRCVLRALVRYDEFEEDAEFVFTRQTNDTKNPLAQIGRPWKLVAIHVVE